MCHGSWSFHLVIYAWELLFRPPGFHSIHIHDPFLVDKHYRLLFGRIIADLILEPIDNLIFACEEYNS